MTLGVREGSSSLRKVCLVAKSKCPMLLMLMKPLYISPHGTPFSSEPWLLISSMVLCVCSVKHVDHRWRQNVVGTKKVAHTNVFTTFLCHLWSITVRTHSNMEFICFVWFKSKVLLMIMSSVGLSSTGF